MYVRKNEKGYILIESLIGLLLLSIVSFSLLLTLPLLIEARQRLDIEQAIYHHLIIHQLTDTLENQSIDAPIPFTIFHNSHTWCATYQWRDDNEKTICL